MIIIYDGGLFQSSSFPFLVVLCPTERSSRADVSGTIFSLYTEILYHRKDDPFPGGYEETAAVASVQFRHAWQQAGEPTARGEMLEIVLRGHGQHGLSGNLALLLQIYTAKSTRSRRSSTERVFCV